MNIKIAITVYMLLSLICCVILVYYKDKIEQYLSLKSPSAENIYGGLALIVFIGAFLCIFGILYVGIKHMLFFIPSDWGQVDADGGVEGTPGGTGVEGTPVNY